MACIHKTEDQDYCPKCTCEECKDEGHLICDCTDEQINCDCCEHDPPE